MRISPWKAGYALVLISGAVYGFVELRGPNGTVAQLMQKRQRVHSLEETNARLHREIEAETARIKRLEDNPEENEIEIRKRLKLVKPGEKSYILQEAAPGK